MLGRFIHKLCHAIICRIFSVAYWGRIVLYIKYFFIELFCFKRVILLHAYLPNRGLRIGYCNLGDDLNLVLLRFLSHKIVVPYCYSSISRWLKRDVYMCIGSNLNSPKHNAIVWGNGSMFENLVFKIKPKKVLAVRGSLTRRNLLANGIECPEIYGDPALLMSRYYRPQGVGKKYKLGIIPHFHEQDISILQEYKKLCGVCILDIHNYGTWQSFIDKICACEFILSSSLHGIILADTYEIPNVWIKLSDRVLGGGFKFLDYFHSVGKDDIIAPLVLDHVVPVDELIEKKKDWRRIEIDLDKLMEVCPFNK